MGNQNQNQLFFHYLNLLPYDKALVQQEMKWSDVGKEKKCAHFFGVEHLPVITLGKRGVFSTDIKFSEQELRALGFEIVQTDRGGLATIHSPGQLVIYPIVPLREFGFIVSSYVNFLLHVTQQTLLNLGVQTEQRENTGLYTKKGKICFVGIRVEKGVTRHGISINVNNDVDLFNVIHPCGMTEVSIDRLKNHGHSNSTQDIFFLWQKEFCNQYYKQPKFFDKNYKLTQSFLVTKKHCF